MNETNEMPDWAKAIKESQIEISSRLSAIDGILEALPTEPVKVLPEIEARIKTRTAEQSTPIISGIK